MTLARRTTAERARLLLVTTGVPLAALLLPAISARADMARPTRIKAMQSVVKLGVMKRRGNRLVQVGHGSGSVIAGSGLILTNNHVVQNTRTKQLHDAITVAPTRNFDSAPKPVCIAWPKRAIRYPALDLAVIKCEADMRGRKLKRQPRWPNVVQVGDSTTLVPGDELYIVGYPGVGGATITFTSGKVSGFLADKRVGKGRVWIKTDALISGGVSGGAAFDKDGKLIGVPTAYRRGTRGHTNIGLVRVIQKAKPLLALVTRKPWNQLPRVAKRVPKVAKPPSLGYPSRPPRGVRPVPRLPGLRPGRRPKPRTPRTPPTGVPRVGSGLSLVVGRVVDAGTSRPVAGAAVVLVKPGVNVFRITGRTLRRQISGYGVANSRGFFRSTKPLRQGGSYGLLVVASGFLPLRLNGAVSLLRGTPPMFNVGLIKLRRRGARTRPRRRLPQLQEVP